MVIHTLSGQFAYDPAGSQYKSGEWILGQLIDIFFDPPMCCSTGPKAAASAVPISACPTDVPSCRSRQ